MPGLTTWVTDAVRAELEGAGHWGATTWVDLMRAAAEADPEALAVADETGRLTRGEVAAQARRLAAYLAHRGLRPGDVVTLVLPNWREFVVVHAAVGLAGGVVNPLLPKVGGPEMAHIMRTAGTRFVVAAAEHRGRSPWEVATAAAADIPAVEEVVPVRGGTGSLEEILAQPWEETHGVPEVAVDPRAWDTVTFTSGTESLPKGVVHSHQTTMFGLTAYVDQVLGMTADDVVFMPSPVCHASGLEWGLRTAIFLAAPLVLQDRWDPAVALRMVDEHRCTYTLAATPFIIDLIAERARSAGAPGTSLRYVASGGAPIPRHLVAGVREAFGAELMAVFGASETYISTATRPGSPDRMLASDGAALPGVEMAIVDDDGDPVPAGGEGEIATRGPHVFLGYLGDPELTHRAFRGEWYRYGDLGRIDEDGMLHVTGRIKDIVIRGGENISVREVEEALAVHPDVATVAVVAYPDERLGERCCAVVVAEEGTEPTLDGLNRFLREGGMPTFKLPERLWVIDEMPMTTTGKIRKAELRQTLRAEPA